MAPAGKLKFKKRLPEWEGTCRHGETQPVDVISFCWFTGSTWRAVVIILCEVQRETLRTTLQRYSKRQTKDLCVELDSNKQLIVVLRRDSGLYQPTGNHSPKYQLPSPTTGLPISCHLQPQPYLSAAISNHSPTYQLPSPTTALPISCHHQPQPYLSAAITNHSPTYQLPSPCTGLPISCHLQPQPYLSGAITMHNPNYQLPITKTSEALR